MSPLISQVPVVHPRTIVILEDDNKIASQIQTLLGVFGFEPRQLFEPEEVVEMASRGESLSFVLDIQLNNKPVGLDVLEDIKSRKPECFVCIYSSYINDETLRRRARRLNADFILNKSTHQKRDIYLIAQAILNHELELTLYQMQLIDLELERLQQGAPLSLNWNNGRIEPALMIREYSIVPVAGPKIASCDVNVAEYERLRLEPGWCQQNNGMYVGIVNGQVQITDRNPARVLSMLREKFPAEERFIKLIDLEEDSPLEMPSPTSID